MGNSVDWLRWLADTLGKSGDSQEDNNAQEGGQDRNEGVLGATVLWHLDELLDDPANEIIPGERRGK